MVKPLIYIYIAVGSDFLSSALKQHFVIPIMSASEQYLTATAGGHLFLTRYLLHRFRRSQSCSGQQAIEKLVIEISSDSVSVS